MSDVQRTGQAEAASSRRMVWVWGGLLLILTLLYMEKGLFPPAGQALTGHDVRGLFYPWYTTVREALRAGRLPLWDPYEFGGYPFLSNPQVALFYPPTWLAILLPLNVGISFYVALHLWLAGLGMLLFVRSRGGSWTGAALAGLTFGFSGFFAARISAGHIGLLATHAWIPWLLLSFNWSLKRGDIWAAIVAGLTFGLAILAGHPTSLLFVGLIWLAFALYLGATGERWGLIARQMAIIGLTGLALSAVQLLPFLQFSLISTRAAGVRESGGLQWSLPLAHLITLIIPRYFGDPLIGYWSVDNFEELTYYAGILPLLGIAIALRRPTRSTWLYIGLIVFGLLAALGTYGFLYPILYDLVLPFRLARAPARAAFLFVFAASALLGETVSQWERIPVQERRALADSLMRPILLVGAIVGVAGLAATGAVFASQHPSETSGRLWHQIGGWSWALAAFLIGGLLLWRYLSDGGEARLRKRALVAALAALVVSDLWVFGFRLIRLQPIAPAPLWTEARRLIGETDELVLPWGVGPFFIHNDAGLVGLYSVFGYNTLEIAANHDLTTSVPDPRSAAYDVLGAAYVITGEEIASSFVEGEGALELIERSDAVWVYRRPNALPVTRLVYAAEVIGDRENAIARVHQPDFNPAETAILDAPPPCEIGPAPEAPGTARILEREPGYWLIETQSEAPSLLLVSEAAYPGWRVSVDGEQAEPLVAYTAIRAVCVPAGDHRVEWKFSPSIYWLGGAISLIALAVVGGAWIIVQRRHSLTTPYESVAEEADQDEA